MKLNHSIFALLLIIAGVFTAIFIKVPPLGWLLGGLFLLVVSFCFLIFNRRWFGWLILICFFCSGGFLFSMNRGRFVSDINHNRVFSEKVVVLEGVMVERPAITATGTQFLFKIDKQLNHLPVGKITVYDRATRVANNWFGHKLRLVGRFKKIQNNRTSFPDYLEQQGITGSIYLTETPELLKGFGLSPPFIWANKIRESLIEAGNKVLQPNNAKLLHSMIFGDSLGGDDAEEQLLRDLRRTGTIHLLSVSGLHIGFILITLTFLLGWLKVPKKWRILPIALCTSFYIMMTGMEAPVMRAGLMVFIYLAADYLGTEDNNLNRLSLAAIILVWVNPYNLFAVGFQLSFGATLGVVWLYPQLKKLFKVKNSFFQFIMDGILVSIGAQLTVIPLIVFYFQQVSWVSPLVNLLLLIPGEVIVIGGVAGEGLYLLFPWLGWVILIVVNWAIALTRFITHLFGIQPWAASVVPPWPWPWIFGYYLALMVLLVFLRPNLLTGKIRINKGAVIISFIVILNLVIWAIWLIGIQEKYLQISFVDVGQGDAIFIKTPDGSVDLVDGGDETKGSKRVIPFLYKNGISKLDQIFLTHYHQDHLAGLTEVLEEVSGNILYLPPALSESLSGEFAQQMKKLKIKRKTVYSGMKFQLGKLVVGEVLHIPDPGNENDNSQVLLINYGKNKLLLTGDLSSEGEAVLARMFPSLLKATILKVGHHGSNESSNLFFLSQVKPKLAVISVGASNRYRHPGAKTLNRLRSLGATVYRTDLSGTVTLKLYKDRIIATTAKK